MSERHVHARPVASPRRGIEPPGPCASPEKLAEALRAVFTEGTSYTALEVLKELRARGMSPRVADPLGAIRYALAAGSEFERVPGERDRYRSRE